MFSVTCEIAFCYGHRLLGHKGKCRHLHGHNGRAVITVEADKLDELGMVVDFGDLKHVVGKWIDETLDHKMLLHRDDPLLAYLKAQGEPIHVMEVNPTAENVAKAIYEHAARQGFRVVEVKLWETDRCCACYRAAGQGGERGKR